ncbi:sugar phosphate isomerase/epimerase [Actinomycetes bacterium KLBMP 9759]
MTVRVLAFTKPFGPMTVGRLADAVVEVGADGADLVVRDGQTVTPAEPERIGAVAAALRANGADLDIVTTDLVEPGAEADRVLGACADAGVDLARLGFFRYDAALGYRRCLDTARRDLAALVDTAARHDVRPVLQLHHGTVHPSAALALRLLEDLDGVAVYADPGNQSKEGSESWPMHLDLLGERIVCTGVKNAAWHEGPAGWTCDWQPFTDGGVVPWPGVLATLRERGYAGALSLHVHYAAPDPVAAVARDLAHLRSLLTPQHVPA